MAIGQSFVVVIALVVLTTASPSPHIIWEEQTSVQVSQPTKKLYTSIVPPADPHNADELVVVVWNNDGVSGVAEVDQRHATTGKLVQNTQLDGFGVGRDYAIGTSSNYMADVTMYNYTKKGSCDNSFYSYYCQNDVLLLHKDYVIWASDAQSPALVIFMKMPASRKGNCDVKLAGMGPFSYADDSEVWFSPSSTSFYATGGHFYHPDDFTGINNNVKPFCQLADSTDAVPYMGSDHAALVWLPKSKSLTCADLTAKFSSNCFLSINYAATTPTAAHMAPTGDAVVVFPAELAVIDATACKITLIVKLPFTPKVEPPRSMMKPASAFPVILPAMHKAIVAASDGTYWSLDLASKAWTKLPWDGICDVSDELVACVDTDGNVEAFPLSLPDLSAGAMSLHWTGGELVPTIRISGDVVYVAWQSNPESTLGHTVAIAGFRAPSPTLEMTPTHSASIQASPSATDIPTASHIATPSHTIHVSHLNTPTHAASRSLTLLPTASLVPTPTAEATATLEPTSTHEDTSHTHTKTVSVSHTVTPPLTPTPSVSASVACWRQSPAECTAPHLSHACAWNAAIGGCVVNSATDNAATCVDLPRINPFGQSAGAACEGLSSRCKWCGTPFALCFPDSDTPDGAAFQCPTMCSQMPLELCTAAGCHLVHGYCSSDVCFSFLRKGFNVMPLAVFGVAVTKASLVLLLWSFFGSTLLRFLTHAKKGFHRATPLVATDERPMCKPGDDNAKRLALTLGTIDSMDDYVQALLVQNFGVADATAEQRDHVAHVLIKSEQMPELFPEDRPPLAADDDNDNEGADDDAECWMHSDGDRYVGGDLADRVEAAIKKARKGGARASESDADDSDGSKQLVTIHVCYVASHRTLRRFATAINIFPGNIMLSGYLFFAALLLGLSAWGVAGFHDAEKATKYQLIAFRLMNSSLLVSASFVAVKWLRGAALRLHYVTQRAGMPLSHRAEVHRFRRRGVEHAVFFLYLATIVPFGVLALYGAARFLWLPLACAAGAGVVTFAVRPALHRFIDHVAASCCGAQLDGERELRTTSDASGPESGLLTNNTDDREVATATTNASFGIVSYGSLGPGGSDTGSGALNAPTAAPIVSDDNIGTPHDASSTTSSSSGSSRFALHALVSFLTIDAVWATAFAIGAQMCFNYAVMLLNLHTFGITAGSIPRVEFSARSTDCLMHLLNDDVAEFSLEASHLAQLVSSVFPFF